MPNDLYLTNGETKIGVFHRNDRKKPSLGVQKGNCINVYGTFTNEEKAKMFMKELLAVLVGVEYDPE